MKNKHKVKKLKLEVKDIISLWGNERDLPEAIQPSIQTLAQTIPSWVQVGGVAKTNRIVHIVATNMFIDGKNESFIFIQTDDLKNTSTLEGFVKNYSDTGIPFKGMTFQDQVKALPSWLQRKSKLPMCFNRALPSWCDPKVQYTIDMISIESQLDEYLPKSQLKVSFNLEGNYYSFNLADLLTKISPKLVNLFFPSFSK